MKPAIDIVIPVYNEAKTIRDNVLFIDGILKDIPHRFVIVNDGSRDNTWEIITDLYDEAVCITAISLSRNFGKEAAICAGLAEVDAQGCVVMDADLQHPPEMIGAMYQKWLEGWSIVECVKKSRGKEGVANKLSAGFFYSVINKVTAFDFSGSSDFMLLDTAVIKALSEMGDTTVFFRGMVEWLGFEKYRLPFDVRERTGGKSRFTRMKLAAFALNAISLFSSKPLLLTVIIGIAFFVGAFLLILQTLFNKFTGASVSGFTTVIILVLVVGGLILFGMSVIAMYIARIFDEVKGRPRYVVKKKIENR